MLRRLLLSVILLVAIAPIAHAAPSIALISGSPRSFTLAGNALSDAFFFDAPADAAQLRFAISGTTDVDLLVRYGSPFPGTVPSDVLSVNYLGEGAHYRAISAENSELITIGRYNVRPVRAGRWYVVVLNFANTPSTTSITVTASTAEPGALPINVVFDDSRSDGFGACSTSEWNDSTPRAAVGGNSGTTLGQQRRNAVLEAARILSAQLRSPVPIRVKACWANLCDDPATAGDDSLRCTASSAVLASAGPRNIFLRATQMFRDDDGSPAVAAFGNAPFLPRAQTFYASAPATKLAGAATCALVGGPCDSTYEARITFNNQIGQTTVLGGRNWWFGLSPQPQPATETDFISTALHELTHGMGFTSFINIDDQDEPIGAKLDGYDDIFAANTVSVGDDQSVRGFTAISDAARAAALTSISGLRWSGTEAATSIDNVRRDEAPPNNLVRLFAPNPVQPGSTLSHVTGTGTFAGLMQPAITGAPRNLGIAGAMLGELGWSSANTIVATESLPRPSLYYDRTRDNHGISFGRVTGNIYYLLFYTYDQSGNPEWFIASGPVVDGVFLASTDASGRSLLRIKFRPGQTPETSVDVAASGIVRLDFNHAQFAPACNDGVARSTASPLAVMTWSLGDDIDRNWCMESILPSGPGSVATPNFTGAWNSVQSGWGFDLASFRVGGSDLLSGLLFYPDANGDGRWALFTSTSPTTPSALVLTQRTGYCRTCTAPVGGVTDQSAGTITLNLVTPTTDRAAPNRANLSITYRGPSGGTFVRDVPIALLTEPAAQQ
jgi:hypothetical protein